MSQQNSFHSDSKFWAANFFPKGIGRSGYFNKVQANLLEENGKTYQALADGSMKPRNTEESEFVQVFQSKKEAQTIHEKSWQRFLEVTNQKYRKHISVSSSLAPSDDFSSYDDSDEL